MPLINFAGFPNDTTLAATDANWQNVGAGAALTDNTVQSAALQPTNWGNDAALYVGAVSSSKGTLVVAAGSTFADGATANIRANANTAGTVGYECRIAATQAEVYRNGVWFASQTVALGAIAADTAFAFENAEGVLTLLMNGGAFATFTTDGTPLTGGYSGFSLYGNGTAANMRAVSFDDGNIVQQVAYPSADDIDSSWTPSTGVDLYAVLDDESDADWITTTDPTTSGRVLLQALQTPQAGTQTASVRVSGSAAKKLTATLIEMVDGNPVPRGTLDIDPLPLTPTTYTFNPSGIVSFSTLAFGLSIWPATSVPTPSIVYGTTGAGASGTTSCAPSYPTGISAATSELICIVTGRSNTAGTAPTMPAGWTWIGGLEGGTGTWGVDTGTRRVDFFKKDVVAGTETGTVTVSLAGTTTNTLRAVIVRLVKNEGYTLDAALSTGADTTNATSFSATGSTALSWAANDLLLIAVAQNIDTGTQSAQAITASGVTFGTRTNRASTAVTNGNDHRCIVDSVPVTTGSGSSAPTYSYTCSASCSGPAGFLRLRSVPPTELCRVYSAKFTTPAAVPSGNTYNVDAAEAASLSEALSTGGAQEVSLAESIGLGSSQSAPTGSSNLINQDALSHPPPTSGTYAYDTFSPGAGGFPAVGEVYSDPVFNGQVRRLTNMVGSAYTSDIYAHHWANADGTLAFHQNASGLQIINTTTGATVYSNQPQTAPTYELYWDILDPNVYYYYSGADLMARNLSAQTSSVKKTFPATLGVLGGSLNFQTADGRYFVVSYSGATRVWDSQLDVIYTGSVAFDPGANNGWITISPSGKFLVAADGWEHYSWAINHGTQTVNTTGINFWRDCGDHGVVVSASDNKDYFVTHACHSTPGIWSVTVDVDRIGIAQGSQAGTAGTQLLCDVDWPDIDGHMSAVSRGAYADWAFCSNEDFTDNVGAMPAWTPYKQEIIAVNVVTLEVKRFCHHRSRNMNASYYRQPRVSCSPDGSIVLWTSNFALLTPTDYSDMYAINVPLNSSAGTYSGSAAEAATLAHTQSVLASSSVSTSEAATLLDTASGPLVGANPATETISLAAAQSVGQQVSGSAQESITAAATESSASGVAGSASEAIAPASLESASQSAGVAAAEAVALEGTQAALRAAPSSAVEASTLTDAPSSGFQLHGAMTEVAALTVAQDFSGSGQPVSISEVATLADMLSAPTQLPATGVETLTMLSAEASQTLIGSAAAESIALQTTQTGSQATQMTINEPLVLSELLAAGLLMQVSLSEVATLADSAAAAAAVVSSVTESAPLANSQSGVGSSGVSVAEAATLVDVTGTGSGTLFSVSIGEVVSLAATTSEVAAYIVSTLDAMALNADHSVGLSTSVTIVEPTTLAESISLGAQIIALSQSDTLALTDSVSVQKAVLGSVLEAANMAVQEGATLASTVLIAESMFLDDAANAGAASVLSIGEATTLADIVRWVSSLSVDPTFTASADPFNRTAVAGVRVLIAKAMPANFTAKWRK